MTAETIKFERVMYELKPRPATVKSIEDLSPGYRRFVMAGEALADFQSASPMDHIKVKIEVDGGAVMRDYTPRSFANGELTLEFAIHADGPLTNWARNAEVGSEATILGPRGSAVYKGGFDAGVLIGDDTFLPTVGRAAEMYGDVSLLAIVEVNGAEEEIELPAGVQVIWAHKGDRLPGEALVEALAAAALPEGAVLYLAGGEATAMRDVRRHLLNVRGVPRENIKLSGHWKRGESDFDHHAEIEE
ncbi:MAG: siderophore-interacting protein [Thermomicrobiales bacterium]|nr:siderophore-interacting protein [Thermomicrobiales bacterium]MCO5224275.1 siderophore-interacting protein [Thermomicrobiales bacterium]MCO5229448.1 siderophore-interacting protein [Thermomicrobiales bacterium]